MKYAADTSFIIELFVDEPRTAVSKEIFNRLKISKEKVFIPVQTIIEVIYVLEKFYKLDRVKVVEYVSSILGTSIFVVDKYMMFYKILETYVKNPSIKLGDIIIAEDCKNENICSILTFDKHFGKLGLDVVSN